MDPVMAVGDAEDVHIQGVLILCTPGDLALSKEYTSKRLLSMLVLHSYRQEGQRILIASVHELHHSHGAGRTG